MIINQRKVLVSLQASIVELIVQVILTMSTFLKVTVQERQKKSNYIEQISGFRYTAYISSFFALFYLEQISSLSFLLSSIIKCPISFDKIKGCFLYKQRAKLKLVQVDPTEELRTLPWIHYVHRLCKPWEVYLCSVHKKDCVRKK